ncbi:MAG TPA: ATP-binding cassette domain-containing protein [Solirubrobacteraceae bacterium]|nr:ATP-binding cassette domain-containing protein [Solirubrobacteraceae bacterium]
MSTEDPNMAQAKRATSAPQDVGPQAGAAGRPEGSDRADAGRPEGSDRADTGTPLLEVEHVDKYFGSVNALQDISLKVNAGEVTCVLGDNGAGKSTLIKILAGVHKHDAGRLLVNGEEASFNGPRDAQGVGIATVFQDLATVPLMSVWRNFFLGNEPRKGWGPFKYLDSAYCQRVMLEELSNMGIDVRDPNQTVGTLSGGERQAVAIARAVYFGAKVLILDEPTSALGVRQSGIVLKYIIQARQMGRGVVFITHNPHHAFPVGDRFVLLRRGRMMGSYEKSETSIEALTSMMAGGAELEALSHELADLATDPKMQAVAQELAAEVPPQVNPRG